MNVDRIHINNIISLNRNKKELPKPFPYFGGKHYLVNRLLSLIPPHDIYIEPFAGGASLFYAKKPSRLEVLADLDRYIIQLHQLLKEGKFYDFGVKCLKNLLKSNPDRELMMRLKEKYWNNTANLCEAYIAILWNSYPNIRLKIFKTLNTLLTLGEDFFDQYRERLKNVILLNTDYKQAIAKFDSSNTFVYLDPPYYLQEAYKINWDLKDYADMFQFLSKIKSKFMLSLGYHKDILKLIPKSFHIYLIRVFNSYRGTSRIELLITNYDIMRYGDIKGVYSLNKVIKVKENGSFL